jgi:hypothetical protein
LRTVNRFANTVPDRANHGHDFDQTVRRISITDSRPKRFASGERTLARQQISRSGKGEDVVPNAIVDPIPFDEKPLFAYC